MSFIFLSDTEMVEAIVGSIAFAIMIWYFRMYLGWSRYKAAGSVFPLTWLFRKIGVNIYKYLKSNHGLNIATIKSKIL